MKKNELYELTITDIGTNGEGIGKLDGYTFFVKDALIGDTVRARVTLPKKSFAYARVEEILSPSSDRVLPVCECYRSCGGCQIQGLSYNKQLEAKENKVKNNLIRIGGFSASHVDTVTEPIIGAASEYGYRNKAQYPFGTDKNGNPICGFYAGRTHSIISNTDCALGVPENRIILETILSWMKKHGVNSYDETSQKGVVRHALLRKGKRTGQIMVCLVINSDELKAKDELVSELMGLNDILSDKYKSSITSISISVNKKNTNVIMGDSYECLWGDKTISDVMCIGNTNLEFNISPLSFYQVNPEQVEKLYSTAIEYAGLTGQEEVWDLCCGIGTITLAMAEGAAKVHGIEIVPQAIEDAKENAIINGINNAEFICAPAEEYLPKHAAEITADVIVMDPPRKGMDEKALETVISASPEKIVYVSCDSATLARDLKYLCLHGYVLDRVRPVDMFPQTVHVETVVLLGWKGTELYTGERGDDYRGI